MSKGEYKVLSLVIAFLPLAVMIRSIPWVASHTNELASWVQAIGSIGAIVYAASIAGRQASEAVAQRREESAQKLFAVLAVMLGVLHGIRGAAVAPTSNTMGGRAAQMSHSRERLRKANAALQAIPLHELGNFAAVQLVQELVAHGAFVFDLVSDEDPDYVSMSKVAGVARQACLAFEILANLARDGHHQAPNTADVAGMNLE